MLKTLLGLLFAGLLFNFAPIQAQAPSTNKNVVQLVQAQNDLSTFVRAVAAADIGQILQGEGPFTVFAPTNQAFDRLPKNVLQDLFKPENKGKLREILGHHVVPGEVITTDLNTSKVKTIQGKELVIVIKDGKVTVNNAKVLKADIVGSNGIVQIIDTVLMP